MDWPLLSVLSEDERRSVLQLARRRRFARGEVVFHEGDPGDTLHLLGKGHVAIRVTTPMGDTATMLVLGPGAYFGEMAVLAPAPRTATVIALDEVETRALHRDELSELRARHPSVDRILLEALIGEVRRLNDQVLEALYVPADKRVARRLLDLARIYGAGSGPALVPLTQEELAQLAGTTRPTANRVLRAAEGTGAVRVGRGRIEVLDAAALSRLAR